MENVKKWLREMTFRERRSNIHITGVPRKEERMGRRYTGNNGREFTISNGSQIS